MAWDVTKAQACVEQLLKLFPKLTLDKARSLLELVCDDFIDDSETPSMQKPKTLVVTRWTIPSPSLRTSGRRRRHGKKSNATHVGKATRRRLKKQAHLVI
jgi:hypothetical protein